MSTLIVAFPKIEEARAVRSLLVRKGYDVAVPCTSGAQVINQADALSDGIIISGYKLSDNMIYSELCEYKPKSFELLLVASQNLWEDCQDSNVVCVAMPIKVNDLLSTIEIMLQSQIRKRSGEPILNRRKMVFGGRRLGMWLKTTSLNKTITYSTIWILIKGGVLWCLQTT